MSPDLPEEFFKLSLSDKPKKPLLTFPDNATEKDKQELEENCKLAGEICSILSASLKYGFDSPIIVKHFFLAIHIYGGRDTIIAYYPSRLFQETVVVQHGEGSNRYFLLDCRTGLLGALDRRIDVDDRIVREDGRILIKNVRDIPPEQIRYEANPSLILIKKQLSDQYIVRKGPTLKKTFIVIITQSDHPDRLVIKV